MKVRPGPVISVVLLVGLGAWVYFAEFRGQEERREAEEARQRPIHFERSELRAIRVENVAGAVQLRREGEKWSITEPIPTEADENAVESLIGSLESARIERRIGVEIDLKRYALEPPEATLVLESASSERQTLSLGGSNPIGGAYFALLPGSDEVALVSSSLGDLARKDLLSLRDKSLLALDPWKVTMLRIERPGGTVELHKPDDGWRLTEPVEAPADGPTITDLLTSLERLRASSFVEETPDAADLQRYGLDPPVARIVVLQDGWESERAVLFGNEANGDRHARTEGREPVVIAPGDFWPKVTTSLFDLRRKDLLDVNQYRVQSLRARRDGGAELVLTRVEDGDWAVSGLAEGTVGDAAVDLLMRMISDLKALDFVDSPSVRLLAPTEQNPPLALVIEEEPETEGAEPRTQRLFLGPPDGSGRIAVRDPAWGHIAHAGAEVLEKVLDQLSTVVAEASEPTEEATEEEGADDADAAAESEGSAH